MDESYFVPSMLADAVRRFANAPAYHWTLADAWGNPQNMEHLTRDTFRTRAKLKRALRKWCYMELGLPS